MSTIPPSTPTPTDARAALTAASAASTAAAKPRRPLRRRLMRWGVELAVVVAGYFVLTDSFVTRWFVTGRLSAISGGLVTADAVSVSPRGSIEILGGELRAPGVEGPGGVIFQVRRFRASTNPWALLRGKVSLEDVEADAPLLRISQSIDDASVNIAALRLTRPRAAPGPAGPAATPAPAAPMSIPRVRVRGGVIELGEHQTLAGRGFTSLRRVEVMGDVTSIADASGASVLSLRQAENGKEIPGGIAVQGRVTPSGLMLELGRLSLSSFKPEEIPTPLREAFRQMKLEGESTGVAFEYTFDGRGVLVRIPLAGLAVTLPLEPQPDEDRNENKLPLSPENASRRLRMERVDGAIELTAQGLRGDLSGVIEGVPYDLRLVWGGWGAGAPFDATVTTRGYQLAQKPDILWFAPGVVRLRLEQFADPTGIIDATVRVYREKAPDNGPQAPGQPPATEAEMPIRVTGELRLRDGVAAFERFPYRFEKMSAHITFDETRIDFREVTGVAPSGATVRASGYISPPDQFPEVHIVVDTENLPTDQTLRDAMKGKGRVVEELFSDTALATLQREGVLAPTKDAATAAMPFVELGGRASVQALVTRALGPGEDEGGKGWGDVITIKFPKVAMLPRAVPYPLLGENVTIVSRDGVATVESGVFAGLTGAKLDIAARVDLDSLAKPDQPFVPDIVVEATDLPVDALLLGAVRHIGGEGGPAGTRRVAGDLSRMNLSGNTDLSARVFEDPAFDQSIGFEVVARPTSLVASPLAPEGTSRLRASRATGLITIRNGAAEADVSLTLATSAEQAAAGSRVHAEITRAWDDASLPPFVARFRSERFDAALAVEDFVRIVAPDAAAQIESLRSEHAPSGRLGVDLSLVGEGRPALSMLLSNLDQATINVASGRGSITAPFGTLLFENRVASSLASTAENIAAPGPDQAILTRLTFDRLEGSMLHEGIASGTLRIDGMVDLGAPESSPAASATSTRPLTLALAGARFECPILSAVLEASGATRVRRLIERASIRGRFDADITVAPGGRATGTIRPAALALALEGSIIDAPIASGVIQFDPEQGRFENITLTTADAATLRLQGGWQITPSTDGSPQAGGVTAQSTLELDAPSLTSSIKLALPLAAQTVLADLSVEAAGPVQLREGSVSLVTDREGALGSFRFAGRVGFEQASLVAGVTATRAKGLLDLGIERSGPGATPAFEAWSTIESLRVEGVTVTDARVRAAGSGDGRVLVPLLSGRVHGGLASGSVTLSAPDPAGKRSYETSVQASDIRFASLLRDLGAGAADDVAIAPGSPPTPQPEPDPSRGLLDSSLSLSGVVGDDASRRGRGQATIGGGGRILDLPLLVPLVRASNLQLPVSEELDHANATFFILGPTLSFEALSAASPSVLVNGFGEATWPGLDLNLRFRTRARSEIPLVSGVMDLLRNEFFSARVSGPLREPVVTVQTLGGTTRLVGQILGENQSEDERRLSVLEARSLGQAAQPPEANADGPGDADIAPLDPVPNGTPGSPVTPGGGP